MTEHILEIAQRLRELREICDFTQEELAEAAGIPVEKYAKYENGEKDLPISVLLEVCEKCGVEPGILLTGEEPKLHEFCVTRAGRGKGIDRRKDYRYQSLAYNFSSKKIDPFYVTAGPVPSGTPLVLNSHEGQEFDYVLRGTLQMQVNGKEVVLHEGDSIYFNSSYPHGMQAVGTEEAVFLAMVI